MTSGIDGERDAIDNAGVADGLNESGDGERVATGVRESNGESSAGDGDAETGVVMSRLSESSIGVIERDAAMV